MQNYFNNSVKLIDLNKFNDNRGWFLQSYDESVENFLNEKMIQENISFSDINVVRGLHYQWDKPMGKLIQCIHGSIVDIFVDIRKNSEFLGQFETVLLNTPEKLLWIPPGFAHGFLSLQKDTIVKYMCSSYYNREREGCINILDPKLQIDKKLDLKNINLIMSEKDKNAQTFDNYLLEPKF